MSLDKTDIPVHFKVKAVKCYLQSRKPLRKIARELDIPYQTLWFWVKQYKEKGRKAFLRQTRCRRISGSIEHDITLLKEHEPSLTLAAAQHQLVQKGVKISKASIWHIWRQYGLVNRSADSPLSPFGAQTPQVHAARKKAKMYVKNRDLKAAARMLNALPSLPDDAVIREIPYRLLRPRKQLQRLYYEAGRISFSEQRRRARRVGLLLEKKGYVFSSILANFIELNALGWMGKPELRVPLLKHLYQKMTGVKDRILWFQYYVDQAKTFCTLSKINEARDVVKKCRQLMHSFSSPQQCDDFGNLLTFVGNFQEAAIYYTRALKHVTNPVKKAALSLKIANFGPCFSGDYPLAKKWLKRSKAIENTRNLGAFYYNLRAHVAFGQGHLTQARELYLTALQKSSKAQIPNFIFITTTGLAAVAMALMRTEEAHVHLKKYLSLMKKYRMTREYAILKCFLGIDTFITDELLYIQGFKLLQLLIQANQSHKITDYRKAFHFAEREGMLGTFQRWIIFFPDAVMQIIERGKRTGLPKALLAFPVFSQNMPVYHVRFLGGLAVRRNQKSIRTALRPQEKAFLIHLAMRAGSPGTAVTTAALCKNFWPESSRPMDRLQHLLVCLKKKLKIPRHMLTVSSRSGEPQLINRGFYLTTDYHELATLFAQIKSLERADEWQFAKRDYVRAFALLRGAPFEKMYDPWSESMREAILNKLENEALSFVQGCRTNNMLHEARKALKKILPVMPFSKAIEDQLESVDT